MSAFSELLTRCRFPPPGQNLDCAVSGGPDSMALLVLALEAGCEVTAMHVDHGLRPGSASEAELVETVSLERGASFVPLVAHLAQGPNLEARAREARWSVLPPAAATGHTADDQAETVLLNLLRGAGLAGVAGMRPGLRHPIIALRRSETEQVCAEAGIRPLRDPSNDDPVFRRNRVRHEVMPLLDDVAERDVVPLLARHADQARDVLDHLESEASQLLADPTDADALAAAPEVLAGFALRRWLRACSEAGYPPDAASVARVMEVVRGRTRATEIAGGWRVERSRRRLRLVPPAQS